jgi:hypothetical protein
MQMILFPLLAADPITIGFWVIGVGFFLFLISASVGARYIPNNRVGVIEKLWSGKGSVTEGRILALNGEAGYQVDLLRGGLHFGFWRWQYRIHKTPLVTVPQGKIGYVYARDGEPLQPSQTLGRVTVCNNFQDARAFFGLSTKVKASGAGQRGRQLVILREGVYAINLALFVVITEDVVYRLELQGRAEVEKLMGWQKELQSIDGFNPVVIGEELSAIDPLDETKSLVVDSIGIVTVHDGPSLSPGEIIAPAVGNERDGANYHNNYQDPDSFLAAGGRRGRQYVPLTDGTYFIASPAASAVSGNAPWAPGNIPSTPMPARLSMCRRPTSCCIGSPAKPSRTAMTTTSTRSIWSLRMPTSPCCP